MSQRDFNVSSLRERAMKAMASARTSSEVLGAAAGADVAALLEELRIYQAELEIQNLELRESQGRMSLALNKYRTLFERLPLPATLVDDRGFILEANLEAREFLKLPTQVQLQHRSALQLFHFEDRAPLHRALSCEAESAPETLLRMRVKLNSEEYVPCNIHILQPDKAEGDPEKLLLVFVDQSAETALIQSEALLHAELREKEALLKEVHHRVKNNMQVMHSLLSLERGRTNNTGTQTILEEMQSRIRAMAVLHELVYRTGTFAAVDLGDYLAQVATQAFRNQNVSTAHIELSLKLGELHVGLDQATPFGLLLSELVSNCLKHAFPEGGGGEVRVTLQPSTDLDQWCLTVSDTGVGLPADLATRQESSLGLQLVKSLVQQIGGSLVIGPGASFAITFAPLIAPHGMARGR